MDRQSNVIEIDIFRLIKAMWRRLWLIIIAAAICGSLGYAYASYYLKPKYSASALMYVNNSSFSLGGSYFSVSVADLAAAQSLVDTYLVILNTRTTLNEVIKRADLDYSYGQLSSMVSAEGVNGTEIFKITVTSEHPEEAKEIANTIAEVLPDKISAIMDGSSVRVVDYAVTPTNKVFPNITKNTGVGIFIGVLLSCLGIAVVELLDDRIHDAEMIPNTAGLPVLASVPNLLNNGRGSTYSRYGYRKKRRAYGYYYKEQNGGK